MRFVVILYVLRYSYYFAMTVIFVWTPGMATLLLNNNGATCCDIFCDNEANQYCSSPS